MQADVKWVRPRTPDLFNHNNPGNHGQFPPPALSNPSTLSIHLPSWPSVMDDYQKMEKIGEGKSICLSTRLGPDVY